MKFNFLITMMMAAIFLANCGNSNADAGNKKEATSSSSEKKEEPSSNSPAQGEDIVGEWELASSVVDTNDNLQIDEEERKKLTPAAYKDYMKLNRDGSGLFTIAKMDGRYEIKEESNGRKFMTWYDKANGPHPVGSIMKVTKDELHIKEPGGSGLILWKRL